MNFAQMIAVLFVLAYLAMVTMEYLGFNFTYGQSLAALILLKATALFLVPEKAPMVLVKSTKEEETN